MSGCSGGLGGVGDGARWRRARERQRGRGRERKRRKFSEDLTPLYPKAVYGFIMPFGNGILKRALVSLRKCRRHFVKHQEPVTTHDRRAVTTHAQAISSFGSNRLPSIHAIDSPARHGPCYRVRSQWLPHTPITHRSSSSSSSSSSSNWPPHSHHTPAQRSGRIATIAGCARWPGRLQSNGSKGCHGGSASVSAPATSPISLLALHIQVQAQVTGTGTGTGAGTGTGTGPVVTHQPIATLSRAPIAHTHL